MQFKPPGGELTFWSALWIVGSVGFAIADLFFGFSGWLIPAIIIGGLCLGMWFDLRWCGYVFAVVMIICTPLAIVALFVLDDTNVDRVKRLFKIASAVYFAYLTYRWAAEE